MIRFYCSLLSEIVHHQYVGCTIINTAEMSRLQAPQIVEFESIKKHFDEVLMVFLLKCFKYFSQFIRSPVYSRTQMVFNIGWTWKLVRETWFLAIVWIRMKLYKNAKRWKKRRNKLLKNCRKHEFENNKTWSTLEQRKNVIQNVLFAHNRSFLSKYKYISIENQLHNDCLSDS